jgi:tetratricopeptide (TPR) repeat protein
MPKSQKKNLKIIQTKKTRDVYYFCILVILLSLTILNVTVFLTREEKVAFLTITKNPEDEIKYWKGFLENYPTYKDGWIKLSEIEYKLGNTKDAKDFLQNAEKIDPSDEAVLSLKQKYSP